MTSVGITTPLSILLNIIFKKIPQNKILVLSSLKENLLKDYIVTTPEMIANSFTKKTLIKSFISAGMIDERTKTCADMYEIMNSFKVDWNKAEGGRQ